MSRRIVIGFCIVLFIACTVFGLNNVSAKSQKQGLSQTELNEFAQNDILFYNPGDCISTSSGGNISVCDANLPEETIEILENAGVKEKAEENMERYKYAEEKTGLAWQILAALHFREAGMGSDQSILNGEELYDHINVDGQQVSADANEDAENAANHFIDNAKAVYDKDVINDKSMDSLGYGFLAYNRGYMYKCNGDISYKESPYVMNYYDEDHIRMRWISADSTLCDGSQINDVAGYVNEQVGALAVLAYLCGEGSSDSSGGSVASGSDSTSNSTVSGDDITWIGDSYSVGAQSIIESTFSGISFGGSVNDGSSYIQGCKNVSTAADGACGFSSNPSGFTLLQKVIDDGELKPYLVFALGTNGGWSEEDISEFQEILDGKDTKVVVVTSKIPGNDYKESNERLKEMAEANDNIYLADWTSVYDESYFDGDSEKIHPVTDPGYEKWVGVVSDALNGISDNGCGGDVNPTVTLNGNEYMFPLAGASKDNYLHDIDGASVLSPMPCSNYSVGACHHDYVALDMGLRKQKVDGQDKTDADYPDISYPDNYYYSDGIKVLAFVEGEVTYAGNYSNGVPSGYSDKCGQLMYKGVDGNEYWIGHLAYNDSIKAGDKFNLGDVIGEVGPPPCAQGTPSHVHIHISPDSDNNTEIYDIMNAAYEVLPETRGKSSSEDCDNICSDNDSNVGVSGFSSVDDAQFIVEDYLKDDLSDYSLALPGSGDYHDNCVAFSCWFITNYTEISYLGGLTGDGAEFVDVFYDVKKLDYSDLEISNEPSVYSVASWGAPTMGTSSGNHTGIVIGIDKSRGKILIAEAGWNSPSFLGIHEYDLSEATGNSAYKYINLNKYLKSNTGLK